MELDLTLTRCRVRPFRPEDAASLSRHANAPEIARNLRDRFPHPYTLADAREWITHCTTSDELSWAIDVGGEVVGGIGFLRGNDVYRLTAEMGYWLGREHWGRGIATEVATVLSDLALKKFGVVRLWAQVFETNPASMRVLEKAGFTREAWQRRTIVKHGEILDAALYVKLG